jgi:hypothetical protein
VRRSSRISALILALILRAYSKVSNIYKYLILIEEVIEDLGAVELRVHEHARELV